MTSIRFHRLAITEYRAARDWYASRDQKVGLRFQRAVDQALLRVQADPASFPVEVASIRWVRAAKFPYRLMFERIDEATILVIAVAHTSRKPRYWRRRR